MVEWTKCVRKIADLGSIPGLVKEKTCIYSFPGLGLKQDQYEAFILGSGSWTRRLKGSVAVRCKNNYSSSQ